jgi:hypothetical protein
MPARTGRYHYRLQVERRFGGWVNPVDRRTGAIVDGCHGVVDASESELAAIAEQVMECSGASWFHCRVAFVTGCRRQDEVLRDDEVFGMVAQDGRVFVPGPAHPGFAAGTQPSFGPQPKPLGDKPWKDHGLANGQVVECGSCRTDITVLLAQPGAILLSTPENMRGTASICGVCGRLLCVDCLTPAVDLPFDPRLPKCDRCGANAGPLQMADGQATDSDSLVTISRTYADYPAAEVIDRVVTCRRAGRREDRTVQYILDELRREYGHPAYPFASALERLAYGTAGPPLWQEGMEPDEVQVVDAILQRLAGNADHGAKRAVEFIRSTPREGFPVSRVAGDGMDVAAGQRADCPHAPHDFSCGPVHDGLCAFAHRGSCEAVHPICPACFIAHPEVVVSSIAHAVEADGVCVSGCSACERRSFRYDAELFCLVCHWLVPDVNDRLAERYAANGGPYDPDPGTCPGCRQAGARAAVSFPITCPGCGAGHMVSQRAVSTTAETSVLCACRYAITIPADVWCPGCHLNLRSLQKISELIKKANGSDRQVGDNVKEPPLDRAARRVIGLATSGERRSRTLTAAQQRLMLDTAHLDLLLFNEGQVTDWVLDQVKLRSLGHRFHRDGGLALMQAVAGRVAALGPGMLRHVEYVWDGIGDWRK